MLLILEYCLIQLCTFSYDLVVNNRIFSLQLSWSQSQNVQFHRYRAGFLSDELESDLICDPRRVEMELPSNVVDKLDLNKISVSLAKRKKYK